jgi:hypothetical protein
MGYCRSTSRKSPITAPKIACSEFFNSIALSRPSQQVGGIRAKKSTTLRAWSRSPTTFDSMPTWIWRSSRSNPPFPHTNSRRKTFWRGVPPLFHRRHLPFPRREDQMAPKVHPRLRNTRRRPRARRCASRDRPLLCLPRLGPRLRPTSRRSASLACGLDLFEVCLRQCDETSAQRLVQIRD